jgi:V8-like Glu-specific endopeptidase
MFRKGFLLLVFCFSIYLVQSQVSQGGQPVRWADKSVPSDIPVITTAAVNREALALEDAVTDQYKEAPFRFGVEVEASYTLENSGRWLIDTNSDVAVWHLGVACPEATSISFELSRFDIPKNAQLFIWNKDRTEFLGSFTKENMNTERTFGIGILHSDVVYLEYIVPSNSKTWGEIEIGKIIHGYRPILASHFEVDRGPFGNSGQCNINVNCPEGADWQVEKRSVALIVEGGDAICSGALVNNTAQDGTPYFLTADHCLGNSASNWVFYFNHESATCGGVSGPINQSISGATIRARNSASDFALLELNSDPPASYNVYYAGWDNSDNPAANTSAVGIHHPSGDVKKICFETDAPTLNVNGGAQTWYIAEWEDGVTEGGSSGSPLFNQNKRIIGQLYGGFAACAGSVNNGEADWYGRFGVSWDFGNTNSSRLSNWLDPIGSGVAFLDGFDGEQLALDAAAGEISGIASNVCGQSGNPTFTLRNNGSSTLTSCTITVTYNGQVAQTINWTGNLTSGQQQVINLPLMTFVNGNNTINISVSNPNGSADQSMGNNQNSLAFEAIIGDTTSITINIEFDGFADESAWELRNENNVIVASSNGFYPDSYSDTEISETVCLPYGCYTFTMIDEYGDGLCFFGLCGSYQVVDAEGNELAAGADFDEEESTEFCLEMPVNVLEHNADNIRLFPNPANEWLRLEGVAISDFIELIDVTGRRINTLSGQTSYQLDVSQLAEGVYFIRVLTQNGEYSKKVVVKK